MTQNPNLAALSAEGVSVWLDDLSRERLQTGNLQNLIDTRSVVGVTTNPSIFQAALSKGDAYDAQVKELAERGADVDATIRTVTTDDVRNACDVLAKAYEASGGVDGRVSIEVDPRLAQDTDKTILQAIELWKIVDRPNVLIKIPATQPGLAAITAVIAEGISVNVTLIFSVERHREVMDAYLAGLEKAKEAGHDLSKIHSVASFFVSRVDTEIDKRLEDIGTDDAARSRARARPPWPTPGWRTRRTRQVFSSDRWKALQRRSAPTEPPSSARCGPRPASRTRTYADTMYVVELVAPEHRQHHAREATLDAVADHGVVTWRHGQRAATRKPRPDRLRQALAARSASTSRRRRSQLLEDEGVEKFEASWKRAASTRSPPPCRKFTVKGGSAK